MATFITGENFGISVKVGGDWKLAVCTNSITVDRSRASIEIQNNCTGGAIEKLATTQNNSISFEGDISTDPGVNEIGVTGLNEMFNDATVSEWKVENEDSSIVYYAEKAFLETFANTFPTGDKATFSVTLAVSGPLLDAEPS
jgi:predicted secreted protein